VVERGLRSDYFVVGTARGGCIAVCERCISSFCLYSRRSLHPKSLLHCLMSILSQSSQTVDVGFTYVP
jgi:hypothetical protein